MGCEFDNKTYSAGSLVCANGRELKCDGTNWSETGYSCVADPATSQNYTRVSADGVSIEQIAGVPTFDDLQSTCVRNVVGMPFGTFRLYNSCQKCQVALLSWNDARLDRIRIDAGGTFDGQMRGPGSGFTIIGSQDC